MNGGVGWIQLLMPVIKCKIRDSRKEKEGWATLAVAGGGSWATNYKLGKYDSRSSRKRERALGKGVKGLLALASLTKRLFLHPALIPKLNHSAENQVCSRFMQINDTLQRVNVPRYFITMRARVHAQATKRGERESERNGGSSADEVANVGSWEFLQITGIPSGQNNSFLLGTFMVNGRG